MRGRYSIGLTILMVAISVGCGGGSGTRLNVAAGQLAVSPSTLDFGQVAVGAKATRTGTLTAGNARIVVTSADWSGEGYSVSGVTFPVAIAAPGSTTLTVIGAPGFASIV